MARSKRPLTINLNFHIIIPTGIDDDNDEEYIELMAKVDELQASIDELDGAIRDFLDSAGSGVSQMQQELEKLRADDAVEDTKLDGMKNAVQNMTQAVKQLAGTEPPVPGQHPAWRSARRPAGRGQHAAR
jgi:cob(I)alamin adenosyltransferase